MPILTAPITEENLEAALRTLNNEKKQKERHTPSDWEDAADKLAIFMADDVLVPHYPDNSSLQGVTQMTELCTELYTIAGKRHEDNRSTDGDRNTNVKLTAVRRSLCHH